MSMCLRTISMLITDNENDEYRNVYWFRGFFKVLVHNSSPKFPFSHMTSK